MKDHLRLVLFLFSIPLVLVICFVMFWISLIVSALEYILYAIISFLGGADEELFTCEKIYHDEKVIIRKREPAPQAS